MTSPFPKMWVDGNGLELIIDSPHGEMLHMPLTAAVFIGRVSGDGEMLRFTWQYTDSEDGTVTRGAARLVVQELEDPRTPTPAMEGQHPGADAAVPGANCMQQAENHAPHRWTLNGHAYQCDGSSVPSDRGKMRIIAEGMPFGGLLARAMTDEAPAVVPHSSGPAIHVNRCTGDDCPGHDERLVPHHDTGEMVPAGGLYADKCAECTTGLSCEDAGRCLFEG